MRTRKYLESAITLPESASDNQTGYTRQIAANLGVIALVLLDIRDLLANPVLIEKDGVISLLKDN